ncbi:MAG: GAF domain-containing sensor histidine kinase [Chloroflexi bacterium]|nr:GAF domain-containing sensor histidine kinase [Chloroflexota bacterium]
MQSKKNTPLVGLVSYLRWAMPIAVSFVGIAYILLEQVVIGAHAISEAPLQRTVVVIGLAGPALVWLTLSWAARAAQTEAEAQNELAIRNAQARRRALHLQTASLVGQHASALLNLDSLLAQVVALIRDKFGYHHVNILLVDSEANEIVLKEAAGPRSDLIKAQGLRLKIGAEGITGWVAATGQPLLANDVAQEPRFCAGNQLLESKSELAVPLQLGSQIVGVLDVQSDYLNAFDDEDVTVLQILGNQIGIAIENARLFQETRRRYEAMIALHETSLDMIAQLERTDLLEALLRRAVSLLGAQASSLFLYDEALGVIAKIAAYHTSKELIGVPVKPGEGVIGTVIQTGKPLFVNDYENWSGKNLRFAVPMHNHVIGVPIKWQDRVIGGITVLNDRKARPFDQDDLWLLSMFTDMASVAIKNVELHTQVKDFNASLEFNIAQRTYELSAAKKEIAEKAEQLKSLLAKTIHIEEEERARIARDMHDGVVQLITSARFEMQAAKVVAGKKMPPAAQAKLTAAREVLEEAEGEIRRVIYDLHSPVLDAAGLVAALQKYTSRFQSSTAIVCDLLINGIGYRMLPATEIAVFRMIEEALHNIATHAQARTASVQLDFGSDVFMAMVQDDGIGFDYQQWVGHHHSTHLGLLGMHERVESLGGEMQVLSTPKLGTRICIRLPAYGRAEVGEIGDVP